MGSGRRDDQSARTERQFCDSKTRLAVSQALIKVERLFDSVEEVRQELKGIIDQENKERGEVRRNEDQHAPPDHFLTMHASDSIEALELKQNEERLREQVAAEHTSTVIASKGLFRCQVPMLHPECTPVMYWIVVGLVFIVYETFATPFRLCFDYPASGLWIYWEAFINIYFLCDLCLQFHLGYFDEFGRLITKQSTVVDRYLRSWFIFDLVASLPVEWIMKAFGEDTSGAGSSTRMLRVLRAARFLKLARLLRVAKMRKVFDRFEQDLEASMFKLFGFQVLKILVLLFSIAHLAACFWHLVGGLPDSRNEYEETGHYDSWISSIPKHVTSAPERWIWSMHYSMATMTTVGYGDITPNNTSEIAFTFILLWLSIIVFSGCLGILMSLINTIYESGQKRRMRMVEVAKYLRWRAVPKELRSHIRQYLCFVWDHNEDAEDMEQKVFGQLSPTLRSELAYHVFGRVLSGAPFLVWMTDTPAVLKKLSLCATTRFCEAGDVLFQVGEVNLTMFFHVTGWVQITPESPQQVELPPTMTSAASAIAHGEHQLTQEMMQRNFVVSRRRKEGDHSRDPASGKDGSRWTFMKSPKSSPKSPKMSSVMDVELPTDSMYIEAPAYFGDACVWSLESDAKPAAYTAKCYRQSEFAIVTRDSILSCMQDFPFLIHRYRSFRSSVLNAARAFKTFKSEVAESPSIFSPQSGKGKMARNNTGQSTGKGEKSTRVTAPAKSNRGWDKPVKHPDAVRAWDQDDEHLPGTLGTGADRFKYHDPGISRVASM